MLYIEKAGVHEGLKAERLAERYDMAIVAAEGYANEAVRVLFQHADQRQQYRLFVLHDADPDGYNIARTLRRETRRMPGYHVDVIDLGLTLEEALELGLQTEPFTRKKALPKKLTLTALERRYFETGLDETGKLVGTRRIEINALPVRNRAPYIERKLAELDATEKVIPPTDVLPALVEEIQRDQVSAYVDDMLLQRLSIERLKQRVSDRLCARIPLEQARDWIVQGFAQDAAQSWRATVEAAVERAIAAEADLVQHAIHDHLREVLDAGL